MYDRYGRILAYLDKADGWDYSVEAACAGAAHSFVYHGHPSARADEIAAAEKEAPRLPAEASRGHPASARRHQFRSDKRELGLVRQVDNPRVSRIVLHRIHTVLDTGLRLVSLTDSYHLAVAGLQPEPELAALVLVNLKLARHQFVSPSPFVPKAEAIRAESSGVAAHRPAWVAGRFGSVLERRGEWFL
jgi:hypothetical protein